MNQASFFVADKAIFGGYPSWEQVQELQTAGVVWFVDLTEECEKNVVLYHQLVPNWINYPIKDGGTPQNREKFLTFLLAVQILVDGLGPGEKIYLHCRGGHGRSGLVIACFLAMTLNISPKKSLFLVKLYHSQRPNLVNTRWEREWPLNPTQKRFVQKFFGTFLLRSGFEAENTSAYKKSDHVWYFVRINVWLHQNPQLLAVVLNSGLKTIKGEGPVSKILQQLRYYILFSKAKKLVDCCS
ncbi:hypothetical protein MIV067L [Invertebrate iridescent virus 3]|uniref:Putative tyrosine phosphatase 067L n=1 Tax=Invertebrate iridescent virus 3 TaxID=345201 RepID=VF197_IIV3|nr:hypothetical protein MIV067L [Invertebrate iridescent virus 3]Q196Z3.1 RecName: Full=Putative tyrosine phosphatase 067L [Invertebrate iridescent virus 3]ABF82097.1 hypothetical protein MIV067L [Invertebrate iridescent virus 3]